MRFPPDTFATHPALTCTSFRSSTGPAFSPVIAGVFQEYTAQTWRSMQYFLAGIGAAAFLAIIFFLPETYHGRTPHQAACEERGKRFVPYWFNPFTSVLLLRWPNICLIVGGGRARIELDGSSRARVYGAQAANSSCQLVTAYGVLVPLSECTDCCHCVSSLTLVFPQVLSLCVPPPGGVTASTGRLT